MVPSAHSSPKHVKGGATQQPGISKPAKLPSFEALKSDSKIQAEVAKRLNSYQDASWIEGKPTSLKSGRFRAGVSKLKIHVNWPQDMCTVQPGSKQPTYDELIQEKCVQGVLLCILEESEIGKRDKMLQYYVLLMQDAVELNFLTVKRAHAAVLQEIAKGKLNWDQLEEIEKNKK